jgi:hypothetical protein
MIFYPSVRKIRGLVGRHIEVLRLNHKNVKVSVSRGSPLQNTPSDDLKVYISVWWLLGKVCDSLIGLIRRHCFAHIKLLAHIYGQN